jgi:hypothetical protein
VWDRHRLVQTKAQQLVPMAQQLANSLLAQATFHLLSYFHLIWPILFYF